jgi:thioredoxin-related protein
LFANRTLLLLAIIVASLFPALSSAVELPGWFKQGFPNLEEELAKSRVAGRRLIVMFHQENCSYCQALVERNLSQRSIETFMREKFDVVAVDIWSDRAMTGIGGVRHTGKSLAASYGVQFTPTMLFMDEAGRVALRLNGYLAPPRFRAALEYAAQRKENKISFRDYLQPLQNAGSGSLIPEGFLQGDPVDLSRRGNGNRRPVAIFFEQGDCHDCEVLHAGVLARDEIRDLLSRFDAVQLDLWSSGPIVTPDGKRMSIREWGRKLDVRYAPTVVLLDAAGKEIIRADEHFKGFHAPTMLDYVGSGAYRTELNYQRYLAARAASKRKLSSETP